MRANIYIRNENEDKWEAIPDKSNWINTLLENSDDTSRFGEVRNSPIGPLVEVLSQEVSSVPSEPKTTFPKLKSFTDQVDEPTITIPKVRLANGTCKIHGTPLTDRGKCLQKGCKYA